MSTRDLPPDRLSDAFPRAMGRPANAALVAIGVTTLDQVAAMTEEELLAVHGVGPKAVRVLRGELAARGSSLRSGD
jgi:predicted flap endonuclease-1-like 5' DNA nuclease